MRPLVNFPLDRDRQHLSAENRQQISGSEKTKPARPKRGIRIVSRRRWNNRTANFRALTNRRFVFVRHARALDYAHEIVSSAAALATKSLESDGVDLTTSGRAGILRRANGCRGKRIDRNEFRSARE